MVQLERQWTYRWEIYFFKRKFNWRHLQVTYPIQMFRPDQIKKSDTLNFFPFYHQKRLGSSLNERLNDDRKFERSTNGPHRRPRYPAWFVTLSLSPCPSGSLTIFLCPVRLIESSHWRHFHSPAVAALTGSGATSNTLRGNDITWIN